VPFTRLSDRRVEDLEKQIHAVGHAHGLHNLFNPSVLAHRGVTYIAIRGNKAPLYRPFRSYLIELAPDRAPKLVDLSEAGSEIGIGPVADPKLLTLDDDVYVTFNTGHRLEGTNDVYLVKVSGGIGAFQRAQFSGRRRIEKNWAFFRHSDGGLAALYNLEPCQILHLTNENLGGSGDLVFEARKELAQSKRMHPVHVGTQLSMVDGSARALLIANVRFMAFRRAVYYGRLLEVDVESERVVRTGSKRMINSWRTFKRPQPRHNPSLFSATYFSGVFVDGDQLTASYGVNDVDFGIARLRLDELW
jgi:hypothetical protein